MVALRKRSTKNFAREVNVGRFMSRIIWGSLLKKLSLITDVDLGSRAQQGRDIISNPQGSYLLDHVPDLHS